MKTQSVQLLGTWCKAANEYVNENSNVKLLIVNRKHQTENKPPTYALIKHHNEQREYLSGLYSTDADNRFRIDYKGKNYFITFIQSTIFSIEQK